MVLARLLTPAQVGVYALASAVMSFAQTIRDFGVGEYLVQEKTLSPARLRTGFTVTLYTAWIAGVVIFLVKDALAGSYGEPGLADVLGILCLNFVILPFGAPAFALMTRDMQFGRILLVQTASSLASAGFAIFLAWQGRGYVGLAWAAVAGTATQVLIVGALRPADSWLRPGHEDLRRVASFGLSITAANLLQDIVGKINDLLIPSRFGFQSLGLYSRATGLCSQFNDFVTTAVVRVALPAFAQRHRDGADLRDDYDRTLALFAVVAWPTFGSLAVLAPEMVLLLFGPQWDGAVPLARIAVVGAFAYPLFAFSPALLTAIGHPRQRFMVQAILAPIIVATAVATSFISLEAMMLGSVFCAFLSAGVHALFLRRLVGYGIRRMLRSVSSSAVIAVTTTAASALVVLPFDSLHAKPLLTVVLGGSGAACAWLLAVRILAHPAHEHVVRVFDRARTRLQDGQ